METSYAVLNGRKFGLVEVPESTDLLAEARSFYTNSLAELKRTMEGAVLREEDAEWKAQLEHLKRYRGNTTIHVPDDMRGRIIMTYGNTVCECRHVIYEPNEVTISRNSLNNGGFPYLNLEGHDCLKFGDQDTSLGIDITFKPHFRTILLLQRVGNTIYTPQQKTMHSMHGGALCLGNHTADTFWRLSDEELERQMNKTNLYSPANSSVRIWKDGIDIEERVFWNSFVTDSTILSASPRREETVWQTAQTL